MNGSCTKENPSSCGELYSVYFNPAGKGVFINEIMLESIHGFLNVSLNVVETLNSDSTPVAPVTVIV